MGGSELGCALVRGNLLDLLPRDFSKWAEPEIFGLQSVQESGWASEFIRKLPWPILKTEIVRRTESAYWVVSQRALCSPNFCPYKRGVPAPRGKIADCVVRIAFS